MALSEANEIFITVSPTPVELRMAVARTLIVTFDPEPLAPISTRFEKKNVI